MDLKQIFKLFIRQLIINVKSSIKLTIISMIVFSTIGFLIAYLLIRMLNITIDLAMLVAGIITIPIVLIIDFKKTHILSQVSENYRDVAEEVERLLDLDKEKQK